LVNNALKYYINQINNIVKSYIRLKYLKFNIGINQLSYIINIKRLTLVLKINKNWYD